MYTNPHCALYECFFKEPRLYASTNKIMCANFAQGCVMAAKLVVLKVGTNTITNTNGNLDTEEMGKLASQIAAAMKQGDKVVLVTSGAVAAGIAELGIPLKPKDVAFQQAAAATGQSVLMAKYRELFKKFDLKVAQILLTAEDLSNRASYVHTCDVLGLLLKNWCSPDNKRKRRDIR